jgi:hypothetical protein
MVCREFFKSVLDAYVGWLAKSDHLKLSESSIFSQGSMRLGTTVRPLVRDEFDIDLVCNILCATIYDGPDVVRKFVGDRLREHATYKQMLEPLNRGWRLNYAESSKFYLDITHSIHNPTCANGGLLVPDKTLKDRKPSNPISNTHLYLSLSQHWLLKPMPTLFVAVNMYTNST